MCRYTEQEALKPNSITLAGSELIRRWFEPDSVMEFGFYTALGLDPHQFVIIMNVYMYIRYVECFSQKQSITHQQYYQLETVSIAEPLQNRQHAPLMLSTLGSKEKREGG